MKQVAKFTSKISGAVIVFMDSGKEDHTRPYYAKIKKSRRGKKFFSIGWFDTKEGRMTRAKEKMLYYDRIWSENENAKRLYQKGSNEGEVQKTFLEGVILYSSWGYDQTNIDYFIILKRTPSMVHIQEIGKHTTYNEGSMTGVCLPDASIRVGEVMRRRVQVYGGEEKYVKVDSSGVSRANLWDGKGKGYSTYA